MNIFLFYTLIILFLKVIHRKLSSVDIINDQKYQISSPLCLLLFRDDSLGHSVPSGQPLLHVHRFCPQQYRTRSTTPHHPGLCLWNILHPIRFADLSCFCVLVFFIQTWFFFYSHLCVSGLALVVGLVLYISSINDEMLNRTKSSEAYFTYKYGWSFAFAAISFLLTEVSNWPLTHCCCRISNSSLNIIKIYHKL